MMQLHGLADLEVGTHTFAKPMLWLREALIQLTTKSMMLYEPLAWLIAGHALTSLSQGTQAWRCDDNAIYHQTILSDCPQ
jgi:hypothetical protein